MYKLAIFLLLLSCSCSNLFTKNRDIKGIQITQVFPNMNNQGKVIDYDTPSVKIYYYKNYSLYHLSYHFDSTVANKVISSEDRYHYVVHEKGNAYGYDFDIHKQQYKRKVSMDSILNLEWVFKIQVYPIFANNTAILNSSQKDDSFGILRESYQLKGKADTSMSGSCYLEFSNKLNDINFSLSKEFDSIKNMKLIKINIVNNPRHFKQADIYIDKVETSYMMQEIQVPNIKKVMPYFEMYEKDHLEFK